MVTKRKGRVKVNPRQINERIVDPFSWFVLFCLCRSCFVKTSRSQILYALFYLTILRSNVEFKELVPQNNLFTQSFQLQFCSRCVYFLDLKLIRFNFYHQYIYFMFLVWSAIWTSKVLIKWFDNSRKHKWSHIFVLSGVFGTKSLVSLIYLVFISQYGDRYEYTPH